MSLPTIPLLPTSSKASATKINRELPHLQQNKMEQTNKQKMESDKQEEQAARTPQSGLNSGQGE
jgi:hypothetical protein